MVSTIILSRFRGGPYPWDSGERKIMGGPLYDPKELLEFMDERGPEGVNQWTRNCLGKIQELNLDKEDVWELIKHALLTGRYLGSEWCERHEHGPWAACDAYSFIRQEWFPKAGKYMNCEYYLKLAISKTGTLLLLVSFHPSR